jgi:hypothetical protein
MFSTFWTIISIGAVILVGLWIVAAFLNKKFRGLVELFNELKDAIRVIHDTVSHKDTAVNPPAPTTTTTGGTSGDTNSAPRGGNIQKS